MEEILASIRRIIAEDGDAAAPAAAAADGVAPAPAAVAAPPPAPAPAPAPVAAAAPIAPPKPPPIDDILELTEVVEPDEPAIEAAPPLPPEPPPRVPEFTPAIVANERPAPAAPERIVSPATAAASVAAFSQIASLSAARDLPLGAGHLTLETLVREELRPILKAWLDQHLPDTVERLVQEEIAQLVRDVQRR